MRLYCLRKQQSTDRARPMLKSSIKQSQQHQVVAVVPAAGGVMDGKASPIRSHLFLCMPVCRVLHPPLRPEHRVVGLVIKERRVGEVIHPMDRR
jgi:hypothetical protein